MGGGLVPVLLAPRFVSRPVGTGPGACPARPTMRAGAVILQRVFVCPTRTSTRPPHPPHPAPCPYRTPCAPMTRFVHQNSLSAPIKSVARGYGMAGTPPIYAHLHTYIKGRI